MSDPLRHEARIGEEHRAVTNAVCAVESVGGASAIAPCDRAVAPIERENLREYVGGRPEMARWASVFFRWLNSVVAVRCSDLPQGRRKFLQPVLVLAER